MKKSALGAIVGIGVIAAVGVAIIVENQGHEDAPSATPTPSATPVDEETLTCDDYGRTHTTVSHGDIVTDFEAGTLKVWDDAGVFLLRFDDTECRAAYPLVEKLLAGTEKTHRRQDKQQCRALIEELQALAPDVLTDPDATIETPREGIKSSVPALIHLAHELCASSATEVPWPDPGPAAAS